MKRRPLPPDEQLETAIMWLENNEGKGHELDSCRAVAAFLADQKFERMIARQARKFGLPIAQVRKRLREKGLEP